MKTTKHSAADEKVILTGMIMDDVVLGRIAGKWKPEGLFRVRWANLVGRWCVEHFGRYNQAPKRDIENLFRNWAGKASDDDTVDLVDKFLSGLSKDYEADPEINPDYLVDKAAEHFNAVSLERMTEAVTACVEKGDVTKALEIASKWNRVEMGVGAGIDVLHDKEAIIEAFESNVKPLFKYGGALGDFFGDQFARDEFIGITGATGRGKTWWLIDIAWEAMRKNCKVAFFEVGDMSQNQIMRRFMSRAAKHPVKPPLEFEYPIEIFLADGASEVTVKTRTETFEGPLHWQTAWAACVSGTRRHKQKLLQLSTHPNSSINVQGIISILDEWELAGWVPDVVIIDYADILAMPSGFRPGERDAINETWKQLRSLSQSRHNLVITATQGDANSYEAHTIRRGNFSDDRRKNDHVTAMLGLNASDDERANGVSRLNWIKRREEAYLESRCVHVAGCLNLGQPHIISTF